jgi:hypothetical protein
MFSLVIRFTLIRFATELSTELEVVKDRLVIMLYSALSELELVKG